MLELQIPGDSSVKEELSREHALQTNVPDTIDFKDPQSRFMYVSKAHAKSFNLIAKEEVIGKTDFDFFTSGHPQKRLKTSKGSSAPANPLSTKKRRRTPHGS
jgi:hypothetical protein